MNANIPRFDVLVRPAFLYGEGTSNAPEKGTAFAVSALYGQALTFHVMLESGAVRGRLPIHALLDPQNIRENHGPDEFLDLLDLELWDCLSYDCTVIEYDYLSGMRVKTCLRNGKWYAGEYMFTVDWEGSTESEAAGDNGWKCHHILRLDNGHFAAQPNNRIRWFDPSFTRVDSLNSAPRYVTADRTWKCEQGTKWRTSNDTLMFYGIERVEEAGEASEASGPDESGKGSEKGVPASA